MDLQPDNVEPVCPICQGRFPEGEGILEYCSMECYALRPLWRVAPPPTAARKGTPMIVTEDAIHNWSETYIQQRYAAFPPEVKAAAQAAMVRHHQQGTSAREEAETLNRHFGLT